MGSVVGWLFAKGVHKFYAKKPLDYNQESQRLLNDHKYQEAAKLLEEGTKKYPKDSKLKTQLAQAYFDAKKYDEAIKEYEKVNQKEQNATSINNLANVYRDKGDIAKAKELYQEAIKLDPKSSSPYLNLSSILNAERNFSESISLLEEGRKAQNSVSIIYALASTYIKNGDKTMAKNILKDWLANNPDDQQAKAILKGIK
jgi:tetratricopeptide (TPR) repeat protein